MEKETKQNKVWLPQALAILPTNDAVMLPMELPVSDMLVPSSLNVVIHEPRRFESLRYW